MELLRKQCINGTKMLAYELDGYVGPEDKTIVLDELKELLGCEFTISMAMSVLTRRFSRTESVP